MTPTTFSSRKMLGGNDGKVTVGDDPSSANPKLSARDFNNPSSLLSITDFLQIIKYAI
jgi:hypothetical protein